MLFSRLLAPVTRVFAFIVKRFRVFRAPLQLYELSIITFSVLDKLTHSPSKQA
ncbi:hypothetical protein ACT6QE_07585 [Staphylococcus aureus]